MSFHKFQETTNSSEVTLVLAKQGFHRSLRPKKWTLYYSNHLNTRKSNIQIVQACPVHVGFQMVWFLNGGLKTRQKLYVLCKNLRFFNGTPNHMIRPFEN